MNVKPANGAVSTIGLTMVFSHPRKRDDHRDQQFQFATHRTLCVRLCDGYYFPISFATTSNRFAQDQQMCQSRCAAPARLFTHPNPGGTTEQMLSVDGLSYESLKHAWRFKKEFVKGCSCKVSEYNPDLLNAAPTADQNDPQPLNKEQSKTPAPTTKTHKKPPTSRATMIKDENCHIPT